MGRLRFTDLGAFRKNMRRFRPMEDSRKGNRGDCVSGFTIIVEYDRADRPNSRESSPREPLGQTAMVEKARQLKATVDSEYRNDQMGCRA